MRLRCVVLALLPLSTAGADDAAGSDDGGKAVAASDDGGSGEDGRGGSGGSGTTDEPDDTGPDDGTTDGDDGSDVEFDGPGPVIVSSRVDCQGNGGASESFLIDVWFDDPQGDHTYDPGQCTWRASVGGAVESVGRLECFAGWCGASIMASGLDSSCAEGDRILWEVNIVDEDGHSTGWTEVPYA